MHHCLNKDAISGLIDKQIENLTIDDPVLILRIENAELWYDELSLLSYLLSQILENKKTAGIDCQRLINLIYELSNNMYLTIEEFNFDYICFMLGNLRNKELSLEDELVRIQNGFREYGYDKCLRY